MRAMPARGVQSSSGDDFFGASSPSQSDGDDDEFKSPRLRRRKTPLGLEVSSKLFVENNRLLEGMAEEVRLLRLENVSLGRSVESLTEENVLLVENLTTFGTKVRQFQRHFDEVMTANTVLQEDGARRQVQYDATSLRLAEMETALQLQRQQHVARVGEINAQVSSWEKVMRTDVEKLRAQNEAMSLYIRRLEKECAEQHNGRVREVAQLHQMAEKVQNLEASLHSARTLLLIEQERRKSWRPKT